MNFHSHTIVLSISNSWEENLIDHTVLSEPGLTRHLAYSDQVCAPTPITCGPESLGHKTWLPELVPLAGDMDREIKVISYFEWYL